MKIAQGQTVYFRTGLIMIGVRKVGIHFDFAAGLTRRGVRRRLQRRNELVRFS